MPVLTGILLATAEDGLRLAATDLEITSVIDVPAQLDEPGRAVVPARLLSEIVRRIPAVQLSLIADPDRADVVLRWDRSEFRLHGFGPDQFPALPEAPGEAAFTGFDGATLRDTLRHTGFAAANEAGGRPILTGVELTVLDGDYRAVATDGMRVAYFRTTDRADWSQGNALTLPSRGVEEIARAIDANEGEGRLCAHESHFFVHAGSLRVAVRILEGRFPAVLDLVPKAFPTEVRFDGAELRDACERVALVTDAPDRLHAIALTTSADLVTVTASSPEVGEAAEQVAAHCEGPEIEFHVNARLLLEGLRHLGDGEIIAEMSGPQSLARLRRADEPRLQYLQMPLRLG